MRLAPVRRRQEQNHCLRIRRERFPAKGEMGGAPSQRDIWRGLQALLQRSGDIRECAENPIQVRVGATSWSIDVTASRTRKWIVRQGHSGQRALPLSHPKSKFRRELRGGHAAARANQRRGRRRGAGCGGRGPTHGQCTGKNHESLGGGRQLGLEERVLHPEDVDVV
jgi:hypothetical protein